MMQVDAAPKPTKISTHKMNPDLTNNASSQACDYGIVLFDGHCHLCNQSVDFLIRNNARQNLKFASLQSEIAQRLMKGHGLQTLLERLDSIVFIEKGKVYTHSDAALSIARNLDGIWPLLAVFLVLPRPLRDVAYRFVARNRYRWFGKSETCRMPTPELLRRFLT
jgi:predicted DCC family thiol-disulfide oxidoreductase YuxK